nr:ribonuclease H-like domain-containing protein [Tanacetum cinerariifolium]
MHTPRVPEQVKTMKIQDGEHYVNHINFFDNEYPEISNDDERVAKDLNKSDSSNSSVSGSNINTADFLVNSGNDADSSDDLLDVNNAFLYGDLEEVVYMKPTEGYFPSNNKVYRLKRFSQSKSNYSLYTKSDKGVFLAFLVYVDNIIITSNSVYEIEKFKVFLKSKFLIKDLGKLKYFLRIKVVDNDKGIFLNQRKYVLDLISEYGMLACKPAKLPLMSKLVLSNEPSENESLLDNITDYQKLMGKLIYLTNTRLDISYAVHYRSQFMHSSLSSHLKTAFKILRYLKSCPSLGIHIARTSVTLHYDNNSAIKIAANLVFHERTKHLEIDLHFVRENILKGVVKTIKVDSANQIADILTKGLDTVQHLELVKRLGLVDVYQVETKGDIELIVSI